MGVDVSHYVILGYDLQPAVKKMDSDRLDVFLEDMEELADNKGLNFIYDGMSGEYCFIGKVLNEGDDEEGMPVVKHLVSELQTIQNEVLESVKELRIHHYPALYSFTDWY